MPIVYDAMLTIYFGKARHDEPNWIDSFWGPNYERLSQIKTKFDPNLVFWVTPGVNADSMQVANGRLCKVQSKPAAVSRVPPLNDEQTMADVTNPATQMSLFGRLELTGVYPAPGALMGLQSK